MTKGKKWAGLSPGEKREVRFQRWLSPTDITFKNSEAEKGYKERVTRFIKVIKLEEPDRVPVMLPAGFYPAFYGGGTLKSVMYDSNELRRSWLMYLNDFEMDTFSGPGLVMPGELMEKLDYKLHQWPGYGLADDVPLYQFIEGEYMRPEEYDNLINDPTDFLLRTFFPRSVGAFEGFQKLNRMTPFIGIPVRYISQFGDPEIRASFQALMDAGQEAMKWGETVMDVSRASLEAGYPSLFGAMSGAPFDLVGDMLRGTKGIMMDMFQRPDKLHAAMERIAPLVIDEATTMADNSGSPVVFMPLHKGENSFMSDAHFKTFYWPTFKKVMMGLIEEGLVPLPFAEGNYIPRLEIIRDMPKGAVIWYFEHMDMVKAKKTLGGNACIAGGLPASVLCTGSPEEVKEQCRRAIETCAPGGGYILTAGASMNKGNPDNLRAMMEAVKEYGVYK